MELKLKLKSLYLLLVNSYLVAIFVFKCAKIWIKDSLYELY